MFIQGAYPSKLPHSRRHRDRRPFQRPMTAHAQRLRLLLKLVDVKTQTEVMMKNLMQISTTSVLHAASILQQAFVDVYVRMQRLLKTSTQEIISTIDAQNRFQRFMGSASSYLNETSANQRKFDALESELKMLKEQMALLIQGQTDIPISQSGNHPQTLGYPHHGQTQLSVPAPPPAPPCPSICRSSLKSAPLQSIPTCSSQTISFLDDLICSDVSDSEGEEYDYSSVKLEVPGTDFPSDPSPRSNRFRLTATTDRDCRNKPSFAEQIQERNRVGLKKTRIDRSPGGTPLKRSAAPGSEGFHQEILANALFRKFQNARAEESPERRYRQMDCGKDDSLYRKGNGLAVLFEGEVQDDEWSDKENS